VVYIGEEHLKAARHKVKIEEKVSYDKLLEIERLRTKELEAIIAKLKEVGEISIEQFKIIIGVTIIL